jgi:hypothetical protein
VQVLQAGGRLVSLEKDLSWLMISKNESDLCCHHGIIMITYAGAAGWWASCEP